MVGDTLKKASESSSGRLTEIKDFGGIEYEILYFLCQEIISHTKVSFSWQSNKCMYLVMVSVGR